MPIPPAPHIPLLDLRAQYSRIKDEVEAAVLGVLAEQRFILGPEVERFEQEIAAYLAARHAVGLSSGTDALLVALTAVGVGAGDEVVTTAYSFFATAGSILRLGARPVLVDIEAGDSFSIDVGAAADRIGPRTRAIVAVHLFGRCCAVDRLRQLGADVPVIEDAAQAIGATLGGQRAGTLGHAGCFSFFPSKNLGGCGDGGLLASDDDELARRVRALRVHGQLPGRPQRREMLGGNFRLDALQAAVLRVKLHHLEQWTAARRANAARYRRLFDEVGLLDHGSLQIPAADPPGGRHVYNQFVIRVAHRRDALREFLAHHGIGTGVYYPLALHQQPCLVDHGHGGSFPQAEAAAAENLALPVYPELTAAQQQQVVGRIDEFLRG